MERSSSSVEIWRAFKKQIPSEENQYGFIVVDNRSVLIARVIWNKLQILSKRKLEIPPERKLLLDSERLISIDTTTMVFRDTDDMFNGFPGFNRKELYGSFTGFTLASTTGFVANCSLTAACRFYFCHTGLTKVKVVHGGEVGLNQAIKLSPYMKDTRFMEEINIIKMFFKELSEGGGRCVLGVKKTIGSLICGTVDTLIVSDSLLIKRYVIRKFNENKTNIVYELPEQVDFEILEEELLLDWIAEQYTYFNWKVVEFVGSTSDVGHQFLKGLGGIGAILLDAAERDDDTDADDGAEEDDADAGEEDDG